MFVGDMSKYEKPDIDEKELGVNPYLLHLVVPVYRVKDVNGDKFIKDGDVWQKGDYDYDAAPYCKLFSEATKRKSVNALRSSAKDLFLWLLYEAKKGKSWLWINKERYMEENEISALNTYRSAVNDLVKKGFLIKTVVSDTYWINPDYFFHGDRRKAFPNNLKVK